MLLDSIKKLCALSGPSSYEDSVRDYLRGRAEAAGAVCREDGMGNLICEKKGAKPAPGKLMLAAHMDEVGLIISVLRTRATSNLLVWVGSTAVCSLANRFSWEKSGFPASLV